MRGFDIAALITGGCIAIAAVVLGFVAYADLRFRGFGSAQGSDAWATVWLSVAVGIAAVIVVTLFLRRNKP